MATLRTEEEKSAILAHCLELERTGGDILAYLWSENYISPRATWCNFQREWLGRKPYQYTDGKPKKKKERKDMSRLCITEEQKAEAVRIAIEGKSLCAYLKSIGSQNPSGAWFNIKKQYQKKHPEIYAKIPQHPTGWKAAKKLELDAGENYDVSVKDAMDNMQDAADEFFGKCEDMGLKVKKSEEVSPLTFNGMEIAALRHQDLGEFYFDRKFNSIDWRTPEGDEVSLAPVWWKQMITDLPKILKLLGVES